MSIHIREERWPIAVPQQKRNSRIAIEALVDESEAGGRGDLGLRRLLDDAEGARLEPAALDEGLKREAAELPPVGRIEEGEGERTAGRGGPETRRIRAPDPGDAAERQRLDVGAQESARSASAVDHQREPRPPRQRLDRERPRSGEKVDHPLALDAAGITMLEDVEDRLAQALGGWADGVRSRRGETASSQPAANDPHGSRLSRRAAARRAPLARRPLARRPRRSRGRVAAPAFPAAIAMVVGLALTEAPFGVAWGSGRAAGAIAPLAVRPIEPTLPRPRASRRGPARPGLRALLLAFDRRRPTFTIARPFHRIWPHWPLGPVPLLLTELSSLAEGANSALAGRALVGDFHFPGRGRQAFDSNCSPLAVVGCAALDPFARSRRVGGDLCPQRRDVLAPPLGRGWRRRAARRCGRAAPALLRRAALDSGRPLPPKRFASASLFVRRRFGRALDDWRVEIGARLARELGSELVAQHPGAHLGHLAFSEVAEFEGPEGNADEPVDRQPQVLEHLLDLAVLALAQAHGDPGVGALLAVEPRFNARVMDAVQGQAVAERLEPGLIDMPMRAHPIAAQPSGRRQLQHPREAAVVGQQQETLGVDVEAPDRDQPRKVRRQRVEYGCPAIRIARGGDEPARLMEQKEPRALGRGERRAVDAHVVGLCDTIGRAFEHLSVDADTSGGDPGFGVAARAQPRAGDHLGDAAPGSNLPSGFGVVAHAQPIHASALPEADACPKPEGLGAPYEKQSAPPSKEGECE